MAIPHRPHGYIPDPAGTERFVASLPTPTMSQAGPNLAYDPKRDVVLWPAIEAVSPGYSRAAQQIGSCTGHGYSMLIDALSATQIAVHGAAEDWPGRSLEAAIYAFSRCEVRGRTNAGTADGSSGSMPVGVCDGCVLHAGVHVQTRLRRILRPRQDAVVSLPLSHRCPWRKATRRACRELVGGQQQLRAALLWHSGCSGQHADVLSRMHLVGRR